MHKHLLSTILIFLLAWGVSAQVAVQGTIYFGDATNEPVPNWPVSFYMGGNLLVAEGETNELGFYQLVADLHDEHGATWWVETLDICTGERTRVAFDPDANVFRYEEDIFICTGINPPPPPDTCQAYFSAEQQFQNDSLFVVSFFDLSFAPRPTDMDTWTWDFGDGNSSSDAFPVHFYDTAGIYTVMLTITRGDCVSTIVQDVEIIDLNNCNCPTDEVIPVCVITPGGNRHVFDNGCWAECAGFEENEWRACDSTSFCPQIYAPVCVTTATGDTISFTNACFAELEGFTREDYFECSPPDSDCQCNEIYAPVCVATPGLGIIITFGNACEAECAGYGPDVYYPCDGECVCPEFYSPVCVISPTGDTLTFDNYCFAECEGYGPDQWIECDLNDCNCSTEYDPVCVLGPFGIMTFSNACEAECAGYTRETFLDNCEEDCVCDTGFDPVCVISATGTITTFSNACEAACFGFTEEDFVDCEEGCFCPEFYFPVCVISTTGDTLTFDNYCFAECEGYGPDQWFECDIDTCNCPGVYDPVCVLAPFGLITFGNACEAECAGYTPDQFIEDCAEDCVCDTEWAPVCVEGPQGDIITFGNACEAACFGFTEEDFVACEDNCVCPEIYAPVCVVSINGDTLSFQNECFAACEGYTPDQFVEDCSFEDCNCGGLFLPVCIFTATGEFIEFPNPCAAICAGYGEDQIVLCEPVDECFADFTFDFLSDDGRTVQFHDLSHLIGGTDSWLWDFGDGNTSTEPAPVHTYAEAGLYDVVLTVSNDTCGVITVVNHICVGEGGGVAGPECQAFFFLEQPDPDNLLTFQFLNLSIGGEDATYVWDFGDGNRSTELNPLHTYAEAGEYTVRLAVLGGACESSVTIEVIAGENIWYGDLSCRAWFLPIVQPDSNAVFLVNLSSPDAISFNWDFGDGNTSEQPLAFHQYEEPGTYVITLTVTTAEGCTSTFSATVDFSTGNFRPEAPFLLVSDTEEVSVATMELAAWPNPTNSMVTVNWTARPGNSVWQLLDMNGRQVRNGQTPSTGGETRLELDLGQLPNGIYLFRVQSPNGVETLRLSKF